MTAAGPAAGGFALLHPLPEAMWGPDAVFKLSLRRVTVPTEAEAAAAQEEQAPARHEYGSSMPAFCTITPQLVQLYKTKNDGWLVSGMLCR